MDMHLAFINAIYGDKDLAHAAIVHDPFHIMKRVGEALDELRREVFFRAGPEMRRIGRGARWLILRAWERWETLVRRARGYRDHAYLLLKLRFMTANPIRTRDGVTRFLALDLPVPMRQAA